MNKAEQELWRRIENFELDDPSSSFNFTDRLARENDWTMSYSLKAVIEYKRFMFLACVAGHPVAPSDQVDQVWHLHLIYTQSYWKDFCGEILKKEIHHGPTKGAEQRETFVDYYESTLSSYTKYFGQKAPEDVWPKNENRFKEIHFTRINRHRYWVIPKIKLKR